MRADATDLSPKLQDRKNIKRTICTAVDLDIFHAKSLKMRTELARSRENYGLVEAQSVGCLKPCKQEPARASYIRVTYHLNYLYHLSSPFLVFIYTFHKNKKRYAPEGAYRYIAI
jgi:hypothetical protein